MGKTRSSSMDTGLLISGMNQGARYLANQSQADHIAERLTKIECVKFLVGQSLERIRIINILPLVFENNEDFINAMKGTKYERSIKYVTDFLARRDKLIERRSPPLMNTAIVSLIDYFLENHKLYHLVPDWKQNLEKEDHRFQRVFQMVYDIACEHLDITSHQEIEKERHLHSNHQDQTTLNESIKRLETKVHHQILKTRWKSMGKKANLQKVEEDLLLRKSHLQMNINAEIHDCQRKLNVSYKNFSDNYKELLEELEKVQMEYEAGRTLNHKHEMEARSDKNKILLQLEGQLRKYDQVIGEKLRESISLGDEMAAIRKKIDDFMGYYLAEEAIYKEIVVAREEEERAKRERRILLFRLNHAAMVIQRYFRKWRKWQKKKIKMSKKKK